MALNVWDENAKPYPSYGREFYTENPESLSSKATNDMLNFKNASGGIEALTLTMRSLGLRDTEAYQNIERVHAAIQMMVGTMGMVRSVAQMFKQYEKIKAVEVVTKTASHAKNGPAGWAIIASAAIATAVVSTALTATFYRPSVDINDKYEREKEANQMRRVFWS